MADAISLSLQTQEDQQCDDPRYWRPSVTCKVCGEPSSSEEPTEYLCARCKKVLGPKNLKAEKKAARFRHMCKQWKRHGEFRCHYTGVKLELDDPKHIRYREWEHATPGDEQSVVLATALVNRMKCYLNADEFKGMVVALAEHFADPSTPFNESAIPNIAVPRSSQA